MDVLKNNNNNNNNDNTTQKIEIYNIEVYYIRKLCNLFPMSYTSSLDQCSHQKNNLDYHLHVGTSGGSL